MSGPTSQTGNVPTATRLSQGAPGLANATQQAVVMILNPKTTGLVDKGTGWLVNATHLVTNEHVIRDNNQGVGLLAVFADGTRHGVALVAADRARDLAVLRLPAPVTIAPLAIDCSPLTMGTQVATWGHPLGYNGPAPLLTMGFMSGFDDRGPGLLPWLVLNAAINGGNSGGPLFEWHQHKVRGVVSAKHAPIDPVLQQMINALAGNQSGVVYTGTSNTGQQIQFVESQLVAEVLNHFRNMTQVVIGLAVSADEVVAFLAAAGIAWTP